MGVGGAVGCPDQLSCGKRRGLPGESKCLPPPSCIGRRRGGSLAAGEPAGKRGGLWSSHMHDSGNEGPHFGVLAVLTLIIAAMAPICIVVAVASFLSGEEGPARVTSPARRPAFDPSDPIFLPVWIGVGVVALLAAVWLWYHAVGKYVLPRRRRPRVERRRGFEVLPPRRRR